MKRGRPRRDEGYDAADMLRAFVSKHGTQQRAAFRLGVSRQFVSQIVNGQCPVPAPMMARLRRSVKVVA